MMKQSSIIISALRGGSGKTILSIGIIAALKKKGRAVAPFKKGPDYIDAGWLTMAASRPCYNLDTFLIPKNIVLHSFISRTSSDDIALIEGNRGLYDGIDIDGTTSTAELAKLLNIPVILCIDCTKSTRTMAAVVLGCMRFDPDVKIRGVILNRVAGARHEDIIRKNIAHHCGIPVFGALPRLRKQSFPERHMGLVPTPEHDWAKESIEAACEAAERYLDLTAIEEMMNAECGMMKNGFHNSSFITHHLSSITYHNHHPLKIAIIRDSAFQFYYPENIDMLTARAEIIFISPLTDRSIPDVDAIYIGGGFPETHAEQLAENAEFRHQLKLLAQEGLPIYAECGGLMYLGDTLVFEGKSYPMAGVLPVDFGFSKMPQGHGYTVVYVEGDNPFFPVGTQFCGHEFHYSKVINWRGEDRNLVFSMKRGAGLINNKDGICYKNVLATYTHLHALGTPLWADSMIKNADLWKSSQLSGQWSVNSEQ